VIAKVTVDKIVH